MPSKKKKFTPSRSQEGFEESLTKTIRAIAEDDDVEVLFGHQRARVFGQGGVSAQAGFGEGAAAHNARRGLMVRRCGLSITM